MHRQRGRHHSNRGAHLRSAAVRVVSSDAHTPLRAVWAAQVNGWGTQRGISASMKRATASEDVRTVQQGVDAVFRGPRAKSTHSAAGAGTRQSVTRQGGLRGRELKYVPVPCRRSRPWPFQRFLEMSTCTPGLVFDSLRTGPMRCALSCTGCCGAGFLCVYGTSLALSSRGRRMYIPCKKV